MEDKTERDSDATAEAVSNVARNNKGKGRATIDQDDGQLDRRVHWDPAVPEEFNSGPRRQLHKRDKQNMSHGETSLRVPYGLAPDRSQSPNKTPTSGQSHISKQQGRRDEIARAARNQAKGAISLDNFPALVLLKDNQEAYDQWMEMARKSISNGSSKR